jgi:hypothetical protein
VTRAIRTDALVVEHLLQFIFARDDRRHEPKACTIYDVKENKIAASLAGR